MTVIDLPAVGGGIEDSRRSRNSKWNAAKFGRLMEVVQPGLAQIPECLQRLRPPLLPRHVREKAVLDRDQSCNEKRKNGMLRGFLGRRWKFWTIGICLLAAVGVQAVWAQSSTAKKTAPYNVILVTADQMSANYMHLYGAQYQDTPNIEKLAARGTVFTRMYAGAPWTTPSFGVILTGLYPTVHGMTLPPYEGCGARISQPLTDGKLPNVPSQLLLSPHKPIIPEMLKPYGMITAADNANCWSIWDIVHRGWDDFKFFPGYQLPVPGHAGSSAFYLTAPKTTTWAQQWLKQHHNQRFFLWVHYMEPHAPFNEPAAYDKFKEPGNFPQMGDTAELHRLAKLQNIHAIRRMRELYAGKILYADHYIGELLNTVQSLGLDKNTIIIFTSDHGELLYSHPKDFNTADHRSLYNSDLHITAICMCR